MTYESVCEGGRNCTVPDGVYIIINHHTGDRVENVVVSGHVGDRVAPAPVATTGQITSYSFGDDGDWQAGASVPGERFSDNADGTFTDRLTGLVWLSVRDCIVRKNWLEAIDYANKLSANDDTCSALEDGSSAGDWHLPNIKELQSLVDISRETPAWADGMPFSGSWTFTGDGNSDYPWDRYWSSSSFNPVPLVSGWVLNANFGQTEIREKTILDYAWPVRSVE